MLCGAKTAEETNIPLHQKGHSGSVPCPEGKPGVSVLLIWDNLGEASIKGDVLHIKPARCKAVACTRSGCRFMRHLKSNEQHGSYLCFRGKWTFSSHWFPKAPGRKSFVSCWHLGSVVMNLPTIWAWTGFWCCGFLSLSCWSQSSHLSVFFEPSSFCQICARLYSSEMLNCVIFISLSQLIVFTVVVSVVRVSFSLKMLIFSFSLFVSREGYYFNQRMFVFLMKSLLAKKQNIYQHLRGVEE